uniref:GIY-YIG domain-containing protein n=1 Tax=Ignavibacterium album TaxID=591197 RepID=A0A7V2ZIF9_9BACT
MMLNLKWEGPFYFQNIRADKSVFESPISQQKGIYLWAVKKDEHYLINYVGITSKSFNERFMKHIEDMYCGKSIIYDFELLQKGNKKPIYIPTGSVLDFAKIHKEIAPIINDYLNLFSLFLLPIKSSKNVLERIESAIIINLKNNSNVSSFLDNYKPSRLKLITDEQIEICFTNELFFGLGTSLVA